MTKTSLLTAAAIALVLTATPGGSDAQSPGSSANAPISYGANTLEYGTGGTLTLSGAVELVQGQNRFRADRMSGLNLTSDSRIEASGNVYFVTPTQTIRGDRATYNTADATIVVTGDVILTQGENVMTGSRLTYNVRTETARVDGGQSGRVRGVFYPGTAGN
ncbi:MAG: lipopolysaccharide export system protein LptA [bacterium]|nr:MAG: lipopolysaccharide export system protein LptA [bacterium]